MRILKLITLSIFLFTLMISCGENKINVPENIVVEEKLVPLLVDIHLMDAYFSKERKPHSEKYERAIKMYPSVFLKHNIDRAVFDSTIRFYVKYPKQFALIYDEVLRELSIKEGAVQITPGTEEEMEEE